MTAQGTPTRIATTQLRQLFVELSKDTSKTSKAFREVSGVTFQEFIAQGGNVQDALALMQQAADTNDVALQDMFGSVEAGNAALALTGKGADSFSKNLAEMNNSLGATDAAFATMDEGASRSLAKLQAEFSAVMLELGNEFIPILKNDLLPIFRDDVAPLLTDVVVPAIKMAAGAFRAMSPGMRKVSIVVLALAAALGPVLMVLGPIIAGISALAPVVAAVGTAIGAVAIGPLVVIVAAIVAAIAILWKLEERFGIVTMAINQLKFSFEVFFDVLRMIPAFIGSTIKAISWLAENIKYLINPISAVIWAFQNWEQIIGIVSDILGRLGEGVRASVAVIVDYIRGFVGSFGSAGKALMNAFVSGVTAGINRAVKKVREGLRKIRRLMPGSDAEEGPLSDITASGRALMTTFEKGISSSDAKPAEAFAARTPQPAAMPTSTTSQGVTDNSISVNIQQVTLSKDYGFNEMVDDIRARRMRDGIRFV